MTPAADEFVEVHVHLRDRVQVLRVEKMDNAALFTLFNLAMLHLSQARPVEDTMQNRHPDVVMRECAASVQIVTHIGHTPTPQQTANEEKFDRYWRAWEAIKNQLLSPA